MVLDRFNLTGPSYVTGPVFSYGGCYIRKTGYTHQFIQPSRACQIGLNPLLAKSENKEYRNSDQVELRGAR